MQRVQLKGQHVDFFFYDPGDKTLTCAMLEVSKQCALNEKLLYLEFPLILIQFMSENIIFCLLVNNEIWEYFKN